MSSFCFEGIRTWADTRPVEAFMSYEWHPIPKATLALSSSKRKKVVWLIPNDTVHINERYSTVYKCYTVMYLSSFRAQSQVQIHLLSDVLLFIDNEFIDILTDCTASWFIIQTAINTHSKFTVHALTHILTMSNLFYLCLIFISHFLCCSVNLFHLSTYPSLSLPPSLTVPPFISLTDQQWSLTASVSTTLPSAVIWSPPTPKFEYIHHPQQRWPFSSIYTSWPPPHSDDSD